VPYKDPQKARVCARASAASRRATNKIKYGVVRTPAQRDSRRRCDLKKDPEVRRRENRDHYNKDRERNANRIRLAKYRMTSEQERVMYEAQHGLCALCGRSGRLGPPNDKERLVPDHDHTTEELCGEIRIRGLLHLHCNAGIGLLQDNPEICYLAGNYLTRVQYK
jgi:hypothetical protein